MPSTSQPADMDSVLSPAAAGPRKGPSSMCCWAAVATWTGAALGPPQGVAVTPWQTRRPADPQTEGRWPPPFEAGLCPQAGPCFRPSSPARGLPGSRCVSPGVGSMSLSRGAGTCMLPSSTAGGRRQCVWCRGPSVARLGRGWHGRLHTAESELHRTVPGAGWRSLTHGAGPVAPGGARPH